MNTTYCNSTDESSSEEGDGNLPLSIVLTVAGSAVLAFSMTTQRYGLAHPDQYISLFGCRWHRLLVYFMGLVLYGAANGLKVVGFSFGPFSVLGSVFSLVLVFNLLFARWLLREQITTPKIASSATILLGAILCTIGAPANVQTVFTPSDISTLFVESAAFIGTVAVLMLAALLGIAYVECTYPLTAEARRDAADAKAHTRSPPAPDARTPTRAVRSTVRVTPAWLEWTMALVSPAVLGFDESLADLLIRAWVSMLGACADGVCDASGRAASCGSPIVWVCIVLWVLLSFGGSLLLMPLVYKRFEVSIALPIEYGALNALSVVGGLIFYQEHKYMQPWQLALQCVGTAVILVGIGVGRIPPACTPTKPALPQEFGLSAAGDPGAHARVGVA